MMEKKKKEKRYKFLKREMMKNFHDRTNRICLWQVFRRRSASILFPRDEKSCWGVAKKRNPPGDTGIEKIIRQNWVATKTVRWNRRLKNISAVYLYPYPPIHSHPQQPEPNIRSIPEITILRIDRKTWILNENKLSTIFTLSLCWGDFFINVW